MALKVFRANRFQRSAKQEATFLNEARLARTLHHENLIQLGELFEERGRETVDKFRPAVRDLVLQVAMEQPYEALRTLPGKLSFKEVLVSRINKLVNLPIIRNVHFAAFYLQ